MEQIVEGGERVMVLGREEQVEEEDGGEGEDDAIEEDLDEDELLAGNAPATPEDQELKALFEEAAGADYMRFAYAVEYRLARRLVRFAFYDVFYDDIRMMLDDDKTWEEAEKMLREWKDLSLGKDAQ